MKTQKGTAMKANHGQDHPYVGKRIRLIWTDDQWTTLRPGSEGTINFVDDAGTIFAKWDDGSGLGLVPGHDRFSITP
jgi:hypothetical protein